VCYGSCRVDKWVLDFFCFEHRLAIELDGGIHSHPSQMRKDAAKEDHLRTLGVRLLRIPNAMVVQDPEGFAGKVREACRQAAEGTSGEGSRR
jgi:uroporphyrinogen-III synthase